MDFYSRKLVANLFLYSIHPKFTVFTACHTFGVVETGLPFLAGEPLCLRLGEDADDIIG